MQTTTGTDMAKDELRDNRSKGKTAKAEREASSIESELVDYKALFETAREFLKEAGTKATTLAKEKPAVALAAAVGVGFILGGGLSTRFGRLALLGGVELALKQLSRAGALVG